MILGIDPSTSCGFAVLRPNGTRVQSGAWDLEPSADEGSGSRFLKLHDRLDGIFRTWPKIERVAYEAPERLKNRNAVFAVVGLTTHVESWCERNGLEYAEFRPKDVKAAAGLGDRADKVEMIAAAERVWAPHSIVTDDEADALFVALALLKEGR